MAQQRALLRETGCTRIFEEKVSGAKRNRPELGKLLDHLRAGDVVTVALGNKTPREYALAAGALPQVQGLMAAEG